MIKNIFSADKYPVTCLYKCIYTYMCVCVQMNKINIV